MFAPMSPDHHCHHRVRQQTAQKTGPFINCLGHIAVDRIYDLIRTASEGGDGGKSKTHKKIGLCTVRSHVTKPTADRGR